MSDDIVDVLRRNLSTEFGTHSTECWRYHDGCAMAVAADEIDRLRAIIAALLAVPDDLGNGSLPTISIKDRVRDALALHYDDDFGRCVLCDELWPCETVQLLGPIGRSTR